MRCKNYEPKDSTTNLQARCNSLQARYDSLKMIHETLYDEYLRKGRQLEESFTTIQRLQDELNHIKRTTPTIVSLLNEKQRLQDENDVLHAHFDTLKYNYDNLYDRQQATLNELNSLKIDKINTLELDNGVLQSDVYNLRNELDHLKDVRELNLRAYDDLLTTHQRTLKELEQIKTLVKAYSSPPPQITTYLGKPLEYWAELQERFNERTAKYIKLLDKHKDTLMQNIDLQERIDKANDQLCAFRNLFANYLVNGSVR